MEIVFEIVSIVKNLGWVRVPNPKYRIHFFNIATNASKIKVENDKIISQFVRIIKYWNQSCDMVFQEWQKMPNL